MSPDEIYKDLFHTGKKDGETDDEYKERISLQEYVLSKIDADEAVKIRRSFKWNLKKMPWVQ